MDKNKINEIMRLVEQECFWREIIIAPLKTK